MKLYLAGPMRGKPLSNFPAFHKAAAKLRAAGHEVFSPAERDEIAYGKDFAAGNAAGCETLAASPGFRLRESLEADTQYICRHAEGVAMLPGWNKSSGAQAELALAKALGLEVIWLEE